MPEIAEVQTVRNTLKKHILNKKITNVDIIYPKIIECDIDYFKNTLINKKFIDIKRIGKWLIFDLGDYYLLSHLRMEGKYFIKDISEPVVKHEHVIITFEDFTTLRYHDTRKFGRMNLVKKEDLYNTPQIASLGLDLLDPKLDGKYLYNLINNKSTNIKNLLLDQSIICGLGNIYVDEVLFASGINPLRKGSSITLSDCNNIVREATRIINESIKHGGTTIKSYTSSLGVIGHYQDYLCIHKKELCAKCNNKISIIKINGRSTYYCDKCQK